MSIEVHGYLPDGSIDATIGGERLTVPDVGGNRHRQMIGEWEAEGNTIPPFVPPALDLAAYAASARWDAEVAGAKWSGWDLPTDDRSQAKYMAELQAVGLGVRDDPSPWKFPHGFELVTNAQVEEMAVAARVHVLACFAREGEVQAAISAGEVTTTAAIDEAFADVSAPWSASA